MAVANLLDAWARWEPESKPYLLDGDEIIAEKNDPKCLAPLHDWRAIIRAPDFCRPGDKRLHLGLMPQPFWGDVRRASVYVLLLNPGLSPADYFGEYEVTEYRQALRRNLKQEFREDDHPFLFLDPQFAWHGGFRWWHRKLSGIIGELADHDRSDFAAARKKLAQSIACLELFPYHSEDSGAVSRWLRKKLLSVSLVQDFAKTYVMPRVRLGKAIVIVTRKSKQWGDLSSDGGVIVYSGQEARAAHLTPHSAGGKAILKHLKRVRP